MMMKASITRRSGRIAAYRRPWLGVPALTHFLFLVVVVAVSYAFFASDGVRTSLASSQPGPFSTADARQPTITYRPPATGGALISFDLAVQSARQFAGRPDLALDGELEQGQPLRNGYAVYYLEGAAGATEQSYKVDARSGEVLEMTRLDHLVSSAADGARLETLTADTVAEQFAANHFLGFSSSVWSTGVSRLGRMVPSCSLLSGRCWPRSQLLSCRRA